MIEYNDSWLSGTAYWTSDNQRSFVCLKHISEGLVGKAENTTNIFKHHVKKIVWIYDAAYAFHIVWYPSSAYNIVCGKTDFHWCSKIRILSQTANGVTCQTSSSLLTSNYPHAKQEVRSFNTWHRKRTNLDLNFDFSSITTQNFSSMRALI